MDSGLRRRLLTLREFGMKQLVLAVLSVFALASCNTMIGMGRDFRQLGEGLEHKAHGRNFDGSHPQEAPVVPTY